MLRFGIRQGAYATGGLLVLAPAQPRLNLTDMSGFLLLADNSSRLQMAG